ncbi:hypothetical protein [Sabulicella rubraurantiaca]|uniref:hypothetical protein n=1 Tax=Sabulicella rubraurantiaca TaxID=2811429 RepID=UPI001A968EB4|nr:hypothetical protein [Sabulicella rubraurantiaca]
MRRPLLALLLLAGCAGPSFQDTLAGMIGLPEAEMVARLGVPQRTAEVQGRRFATYETTRDELVPAGPYLWRFPVDAVRRTHCEVTFEVTGGTVRAASHRGDGCWGGFGPMGRVGATLP